MKKIPLYLFEIKKLKLKRTAHSGKTSGKTRSTLALLQLMTEKMHHHSLLNHKKGTDHCRIYHTLSAESIIYIIINRRQFFLSRSSKKNDAESL